jgi:tetratricopeptide (TPR) repeat protein
LEIVKDSPTLLAMIHNFKGDLYLADGEVREAEKSFKMSLNKNPNFLKPYYALGRIYLKENQEDKAIAQYQAILEKNPKQTEPHMLLGTIYDIQKRFDLSEKHYRAALAANPEFAPAANNLAYLLVSQNKNLDEALNFARKAKELLSQDPSVMDTLGFVYYKKGLYDSAIGEFTDSLEKNADNPIVHYHLGLAYYKKGEGERAKIQLQKALGLDQEFDGADNARKILSEL